MGAHTSAHSGFTKEKGFFLLAAIACVLILYRHLASVPTTLDALEPISAARMPAAPEPAPPLLLNGEERYLAGARKSPFMLERGTPVRPLIKDGTRPIAAIIPPTSDAVADLARVTKTKTRSIPASEIPYTWMGRVVNDGAATGLLRSRDGSAPLIVRTGDAIEKHNLTVSRIDPEGIWLLDNMKRPLLVKNSLHTREPGL